MERLSAHFKELIMIFTMTIQIGTDHQSTFATGKPMLIEIPLPCDPQKATPTQLNCIARAFADSVRDMVYEIANKEPEQ